MKLTRFNTSKVETNETHFCSHLLRGGIMLAIMLVSSLSAKSQCDPTEISLCEIANNNIIQACYHAQIAKTSNGYTITGEDFAPDGINYSTVLTNIPGPMYPMPPDIAPLWGAIGGRTQAVFLATDGKIYAIGEEGLLIDRSYTNGSGWGVTTFALPAGITVCDVNKWQGTAGSGSDNNNNSNTTGETDGFLVFSTESGEAYITGRGASAIQANAVDDEWTQIEMPNGVSVQNFGVGYRTLFVLGSDGDLYTSGSDSYLGDGTPQNLSQMTRMNRQPNVSVFGISQIEAGYNSYFVLDGNGTIHVLGENSEGALGVGSTDDVTLWSKVGNNCPGGILQNVAYISTMSTHDNRISSSAILVDRTIRSWGSNNRQSITTGEDMLIPCPIVPDGNNRNAVAISNGGHISPYINVNAQICNIGHNRQGAFGDGNDEQGDYGEYQCRTIPGTPEICGTDEADLALDKSVDNTSPSVGDDITFTITVTNNGPDASTGSFVRDQLKDAFFYISDDSGGNYDSSSGLWIVGPLDVGESAELNIIVKVIEEGVHTNYAQILVDNEVDQNSVPGNYSSSEDDDDIVQVIATPCPVGRSEELLCPQDSIQIDDNWIYEPGMYIEVWPTETACDSLHIYTIEYLEEPPVPEYVIDCENFEHLLYLDPMTDWIPTWDNGSTEYQTVYDGNAVQATLTLTSGPDCSDIIQLELADLPMPEDMVILEDTTIVEFTSLTLNTFLDTSEWDLMWLPSAIFDCDTCPEATLIAAEDTEVILQVSHISGCNYTFAFDLTIERAPTFVHAPNVFNPSGRSNSEWTIYTSLNIEIQECTVYDRWGNVMYRSTSTIPTWDGMTNGQYCETGVYVYMIKYSDTSGDDHVIAGNLTLLR